MGRGVRNAEKTHCPRNHEYTPANTGRSARGQRYCKTCARERARVRTGWSEPEIYVAPEITPEFMWAIGLFEGEGCLTAFAANGRKQVYARMILGMVDLDVVEKFQRIVGCGNITLRTRPDVKTMYIWRLSKQQDVQTLWAAMEPSLGERRRAQGDAVWSRCTWRVA